MPVRASASASAASLSAPPGLPAGDPGPLCIKKLPGSMSDGGGGDAAAKCVALAALSAATAPMFPCKLPPCTLPPCKLPPCTEPPCVDASVVPLSNEFHMKSSFVGWAA